MAQKIQVILIDDLGDGSAEETVTFGLDGVTYEIDLSAKNARKLRDALAPYVAAARRAPSSRPWTSGNARRRSASGGGASASEIRQWARNNGLQVSDRGRVSEEVRAAYEATIPVAPSRRRETWVCPECHREVRGDINKLRAHRSAKHGFSPPRTED